MLNLKDFIKIIIVVLLNYFVTNSSTALQGDHICQREENYTDFAETKTVEPVKVRKNSWCLEIPPRCSNYETEMRETKKLENVTKTRMVEHCCEGYTERTENNITICEPNCIGGCLKGTCEAPNKCKCDVGFMGKHCNFRCQQGFWGEECKNHCKCHHHSNCDSQTGECRCPDGFIGESCHQKCPEGYFGASCKQPCQCKGGKCHHKNGDCLLNITHITQSGHENLSKKLLKNSNENKTHSEGSNSSNQTTTVKTIVKQMLIHPYMNSTESSYASSYKNYMGKLKINKKPENEIIENPEEDQMFLDEMMDQEMEIIQEEDEVDAILVNSKGETLGYLSPVLEPTPSRPALGILSDWDINHSHITHNLTDHPEQSHSIDHPHHHDSEQSIAMVTASCLLLSLLVLLILAVYLRRVNKRLSANEAEELRHNELKVSDPPTITAIKIISEPLPNPPKSILTKQKSVTFEDIVIAQETNLPITKIQHYDIPGNNSSISADFYAVPMKLKPLKLPELSDRMSASDNKFNTLPKKTARKLSIEHIYDEIEYPLRVDHVKYI